MELTDKGNGFDAEKKFDGNGLKNMQQRAKDIHAKLNIFPHVGRGAGWYWDYNGL